MELIAGVPLPHGAGPLLAVPLIALAAWVARAVRSSGALGGALLGLGVAWGAGWAGIAMLGTLLLVGTLATRREARRRGALQAACNGGAALAAAIAAGLGSPSALFALGGALATALGDTVSGELGRRLAPRPRLLLVGPRVAAGTDGAMSLRGTLLGALAAALVPLAGTLAGLRWGLCAIGAVTLAGVLGGLVDSLLGAVLQPRLGPRGNDWVNLAATTAGAVFGALLAG